MVPRAVAAVALSDSRRYANYACAGPAAGCAEVETQLGETRVSSSGKITPAFDGCCCCCWTARQMSGEISVSRWSEACSQGSAADTQTRGKISTNDFQLIGEREGGLFPPNGGLPRTTDHLWEDVMRADRP